MRASRAWFLAGWVAAVIAVAPILSTVIAYAIANHFGCRLDEGDVHPCMVGGRDIGKSLYTMGVMAWLALVTIWIAPLAPTFWIIGLVTRRRERAGQRQA